MAHPREWTCEWRQWDAAIGDWRACSTRMPAGDYEIDLRDRPEYRRNVTETSDWQDGETDGMYPQKTDGLNEWDRMRLSNGLILLAVTPRGYGKWEKTPMMEDRIIVAGRDLDPLGSCPANAFPKGLRQLIPKRDLDGTADIVRHRGDPVYHGRVARLGYATDDHVNGWTVRLVRDEKGRECLLAHRGKRLPGMEDTLRIPIGETDGFDWRTVAKPLGMTAFEADDLKAVAMLHAHPDMDIEEACSPANMGAMLAHYNNQDEAYAKYWHAWEADGMKPKSWSDDFTLKRIPHAWHPIQGMARAIRAYAIHHDVDGRRADLLIRQYMDAFGLRGDALPDIRREHAFGWEYDLPF